MVLVDESVPFDEDAFLKVAYQLLAVYRRHQLRKGDHPAVADIIIGSNGGNESSDAGYRSFNSKSGTLV